MSGVITLGIGANVGLEPLVLTGLYAGESSIGGDDRPRKKPKPKQIFEYTQDQRKAVEDMMKSRLLAQQLREMEREKKELLAVNQQMQEQLKQVKVNTAPPVIRVGGVEYALAPTNEAPTPVLPPAPPKDPRKREIALAALEKAREAREAKKQREAEIAKQRLKNLAKARKAKKRNNG